MEQQRAIVVRTEDQWMWVYPSDDHWKTHIAIDIDSPTTTPLEAFSLLSGWGPPNEGVLRYVRPVEIIGTWKLPLIVESYAVVDIQPQLGMWVEHTLASGGVVRHYVLHRTMGTACGLVLPRSYQEVQREVDDHTCIRCSNALQSVTDRWRS